MEPSLKVEYLGVREPELLDEGDVHWDPGVRLVLRREVLLDFLLEINLKFLQSKYQIQTFNVLIKSVICKNI